MWGSLVVNHGETLVDILASHPSLSHAQAIDILKGVVVETTVEKKKVQKELNFPLTGEGWIKAYTGMTASDLVKSLKKQRRKQKTLKSDIDHVIDLVRLIKSQEVQATLDSIGWADDRHDTLRSLGLSDRNLKSLRLFHDTRKTSLLRACDMWDSAEISLKMLDEFDDVWGDEEKNAWVKAMQGRRDARTVWRKSLHQKDNLTKEQNIWLDMAKDELADKGPMTANAITGNIIEKSKLGNIRRLTQSKMAKLLKMYGEEVNIIKASRNNEYILLSNEGLVLKDSDIWAYAGGFLDADGSIYITDRGEPRASFIATGSRGKVHCEQLHKVLDCGVLQVNQKVHKDGQRSQHRLSFYSKDDLRKLLTSLAPHLRMKNTQAKAVLAYNDEGDSVRKDQLKKLVQFLNWDGTQKGEHSLREWGVDRDTVIGWKEGIE